ncbi:hypothetical protein E4U31_007078, partial [Claviceps sp. LM219 group G6]
TQNLDVIARLGPRQGQYGRGEEHGLVVGMRYEEADALAAEGGETGLHGAYEVCV